MTHDNRHTLGAFMAACKTAGLRLTHQRMEVYGELARATDHPTVDMLHQRRKARFPSLSVDTIYPTLQIFHSSRRDLIAGSARVSHAVAEGGSPDCRPAFRLPA
jgi:hypothetical protein